jgi:hypothetical protein
MFADLRLLVLNCFIFISEGEKLNGCFFVNSLRSGLFTFVSTRVLDYGVLDKIVIFEF